MWITNVRMARLWPTIASVSLTDVKDGIQTSGKKRRSERKMQEIRSVYAYNVRMAMKEKMTCALNFKQECLFPRKSLLWQSSIVRMRPSHFFGSHQKRAHKLLLKTAINILNAITNFAQLLKNYVWSMKEFGLIITITARKLVVYNTALMQCCSSYSHVNLYLLYYINIYIL